jgi:putative N-acetylmannosamine-6-phosphate epimerase
MTPHPLLERLHHGLIVSCQAEPHEPFGALGTRDELEVI